MTPNIRYYLHFPPTAWIYIKQELHWTTQPADEKLELQIKLLKNRLKSNAGHVSIRNTGRLKAILS